MTPPAVLPHRRLSLDLSSVRRTGRSRPHASIMISRNPSTIWTKLEGNVVLLNVELAHYYEANSIGSLIWDMLDKPCSMDEIVERIVSRYRVDREQCRADVAKFLDSLSQVGLLAGEEAAPTAPADPSRSPSE